MGKKIKPEWSAEKLKNNIDDRLKRKKKDSML